MSLKNASNQSKLLTRSVTLLSKCLFGFSVFLWFQSIELNLCYKLFSAVYYIESKLTALSAFEVPFLGVSAPLTVMLHGGGCCVSAGWQQDW